MKNKHKNKHTKFFNKHSFSGFGAHFVCRPKIMTYGQVFQKIIFGSRLPYKKKLKSQWKKQLEKKWKTTGKNQFFWKTSFFKSLLAFITFMNYEHAYLVEKFLHILFSHFAFGKKEKRNKKKVCRNSSCLQSVT